MRFEMPHLPSFFEVPDDWLGEAGLTDFAPRTDAYRSTAQAVSVALVNIEPVPRFRTHPKDWAGFDKERLIAVLRGIARDEVMPPVPLIAMPELEFGASPYQYRVQNGFHRFYGSIIGGFTHLAAEMRQLVVCWCTSEAKS